ncbi:MAG: aminotransferase class V-fold PLP-dependent enzyme, partial [Woeseiaceae bacterium]|nr:aminotransferase class V-fold PLP-dependent enzyme [Woeseiaceae bacterium]
MIDVAAVRADTPGCERLIHFNNAGASLTPTPVFDAVIEHLELERSIGGYEAARRKAQVIDAFYGEFAALLHCKPEEIAFVENATRAWDMVFYGLKLGPGDRVLTHESEYASNFLAMLQQSRRLGFEIDVAPSDDSGQLDVDAMQSMLTSETRVIAITHVPSQGGLVNPVEAVGRLAKANDCLYILDACQSAGQIDLDVGRIGCDVLAGTGRKFLRGPRGTGFLYVKQSLQEQLQPAFIDLHAATWTGRDSYELATNARRYETWEGFVAGKIGLARAVQYARSIGLPAIEQRVTDLAATLRDALASVPGVTVQDQGAKKSGIVTFTKNDEAADRVMARLAAASVNVSVTGQDYAVLDLGARGLDAVVRASLHYYNTGEEIERFVTL